MDQKQKDIRAMQTILTVRGWRDRKEELVMEFSDGRTTSMRDMKPAERKAFIEALSVPVTQRANSLEPMRKWIMRAMIDMWDMQLPDGTVDMQRIDDWCRTRTQAKKALYHQNARQLKATHAQIKGILAKLDKQPGIDVPTISPTDPQ